MASHAVLHPAGSSPDQRHATLEVIDSTGTLEHTEALHDPTPARPPGPLPGPRHPDGDDRPTAIAVVCEVADARVLTAGWIRTGPWTHRPDHGGTLTAPLQARPRQPISTHYQHVLAALGHLTRMARGPVTSSALVPTIAPHHRAAIHLMTHLVTTGHVRALGRTATRATPGSAAAVRGEHTNRTLYAPVGSAWAPERE